MVCLTRYHKTPRIESESETEHEGIANNRLVTKCAIRGQGINFIEKFEEAEDFIFNKKKSETSKEKRLILNHPFTTEG
ncbi:hypothetical protein J6590_093990 [Homalodisca vitripennis]|nr:hypothetical protein J6590_093990 [Homalodisca vitripennis]